MPNRHINDLCSMFLFEGVDDLNLLHCTHKFFGNTVDAAKVVWVLEEYFSKDPFIPKRVVFDKSEMFGLNKDIRVLVQSQPSAGVFLHDLKTVPDSFVPDNFSSYCPHVSVNHNMEEIDKTMDRYVLALGGNIIWQTPRVK